MLTQLRCPASPFRETRSRVVLLASLVLFVLGLAAAACSGSGQGGTTAPPAAEANGTELEAYFHELRRIGDEARAASDPIAAEFEPRVAEIRNDPSQEAELALIAEAYRAAIPPVEKFLRQLRAMNPPAEVADEHRRLIQSVEDGLAELQQAADRFTSAHSVEDVRDLFAQDLFNRLGQVALRLEPCFALQDIATAHHIDVDLSCSPLKDPNAPIDPAQRSEFLTPVAQAQEQGITPYWLGAQFQLGDGEVRLSPTSDLLDRPDRDVGLSLDYSGDNGGRTFTLSVSTYIEAGNAPQRLRDELLADPLARSRVESRAVQVGGWSGELVSVPFGTRPVNAQYLFVDVGDMVVVVAARSGSTGVPGSDSNPLLDPDLLIATVAQHLRAYAQ